MGGKKNLFLLSTQQFLFRFELREKIFSVEVWVDRGFLCGQRLAPTYISLLVDHDTEEELWHLLRDVMFIHKTAYCPR